MHCPDGGFFLYIIESICETNIKKKSTICSQHLRIMARGRGRGRGRGKKQKGRGRGIKKGGIKKKDARHRKGRKKERRSVEGEHIEDDARLLNLAVCSCLLSYIYNNR